MAKTKQQKKDDLKKVVEQLKQGKSIVVAAFDQLTVTNDQTLRKELRSEGISYSVVKKTLLAKAIQDAGLKDVSLVEAKGNVALAVGEDEVAPAKLLHKFAKVNEGYFLVTGWLEGKCMSSDRIETLAILPSKQELIAKTVGTIKAPISGFVNVLDGTVRSLVTVLGAVRDSK